MGVVLFGAALDLDTQASDSGKPEQTKLLTNPLNPVEAVVHMEQIRVTEHRHKHRVNALEGVLATTAMRIPTRVGFAPLSNVTGNDSHYQYCFSHDVNV